MSLLITTSISLYMKKPSNKLISWKEKKYKKRFSELPNKRLEFKLLICQTLVLFITILIVLGHIDYL